MASPASFGGPFTLVGADGKPFSSQALLGKPYAIYFGFTRCGDVCPTTLSRIVKLRQQLGGRPTRSALSSSPSTPPTTGRRRSANMPALFNSPIIGLTGSQAQIDQVKKQYRHLRPADAARPMGKEMEHTATVLLFDRDGQVRQHHRARRAGCRRARQAQEAGRLRLELRAAAPLQPAMTPTGPTRKS